MTSDPGARGSARPDPADLLVLAETIAREVGEQLVRTAGAERTAIASKSSATDLVTELDRWAEQHISDRIHRVRPDDSIEGEEGTAISGPSDITWCIDPIDGTVNFVHDLAGFCVSIAARDAEGPLIGVVHSPLHGDLFTAIRGAGALRNSQPIRCSSPGSLDEALVATGFGYGAARRRNQARVLAEVIGEIADIRRIGSAALDLCSVACGRLDGYWEVGLNAWDHAAGALIAREAGARVRIVEAPDRPSYLVAASPAIWDDLDALLDAAGAAEV